jgi:hypothetical protein
MLVLTVFLYPSAVSAQEQRSLNLMPVPANVQLGTGRLVVDSPFSVALTGPP